MATHSTAFGALLRHFRGRAYMTQAKLAERAGLSLDAVNKLERGERQAPRCDTVHVLACALQLTAQDRQALEDAACQHARPGDGQAVVSPRIAALVQSLTELHARQAVLIDAFASGRPDRDLAAQRRSRF